MSYNPWDDLAKRHPDVHAEWQRIAPSRAAWVQSERIILVDVGLSKIERRCALAHEIAHIDAGDRSTDCGWFDRRQENRADILAARRLVELEDLVETFRWTQNTGEAAEQLEVTVDVLVLRATTLMAPEKFALMKTRTLAELIA